VKSLDEPQWQQRQLRKQRLRKLVQELGSYTAAAEQLGMSRQAVHYLVGPGVADGRRVAATCVDCGRQITTQDGVDEARCPRCKAYLKRTKQRWSEERIKKSRRRPLRTHCQRGHLLDDANTYITPAGRRTCRVCINIRLDRHKAKRLRCELGAEKQSEG